MLEEKPVDVRLDGAVVLNETLYVGVDNFNVGKDKWGRPDLHNDCCVRMYDLSLAQKGEKTFDLGYSIRWGVQTMATDGKDIFLGNYGGTSRMSADLSEHQVLDVGRPGHPMVCEGFGLVPKFISRRDAPVFFTVWPLGGDVKGWRKDPVGNPPRIQIRFYEYANGRFVDVTDYRGKSGR